MKFPYVRHLVDPSPNHPDGILWRPEVPLQVIAGGNELTILALVDSGSDLTLLPRSVAELPVAELLGLSLSSARSTQVGGLAGDTYSTPIATVEFELSDHADVVRWKAVVGFFDFPDECAAGVLGHASGLENFTAIFDGDMREIDLAPNRRIVST
jgi:hypothetical protein